MKFMCYPLPLAEAAGLVICSRLSSLGLSYFAIPFAGDDANEVSVLLNIAYTTLMDEALRAAYQYDVWLAHIIIFKYGLLPWCLLIRSIFACMKTSGQKETCWYVNADYTVTGRKVQKRWPCL